MVDLSIATLNYQRVSWSYQRCLVLLAPFHLGTFARSSERSLWEGSPEEMDPMVPKCRCFKWFSWVKTYVIYIIYLFGGWHMEKNGMAQWLATSNFWSHQRQQSCCWTHIPECKYRYMHNWLFVSLSLSQYIYIFAYIYTHMQSNVNIVGWSPQFLDFKLNSTNICPFTLFKLSRLLSWSIDRTEWEKINLKRDNFCLNSANKWWIIMMNTHLSPCLVQRQSSGLNHGLDLFTKSW
jgi:hypothetical protein